MIGQVKDDAMYAEWVRIGDAGCRLLIAPEYKLCLVRAIRRKRAYSSIHHQLETDRCSIHHVILMELPARIGCRAIRIQLYGQKLPLHQRYLPQAPEEPDYYLAGISQWDTGVTYRSDKIIPLCSSPSPRYLFRHGCVSHADTNVEGLWEH